MFMTQIIIIQVITFLALVFFLRKMMFSASSQEAKRLEHLSQEIEQKKSELESREATIEHEYKEKAEILEAQNKKSKYESEIQAKQAMEEISSQARAEADKILKQAFNTRDKLREEIEGQLHHESIANAIKFIKSILNSKNFILLHKGLIEDLVEALDQTDCKKIQVDIDQGQIMSPYTLDNSEKQRISSMLSLKAGRNLILEEVEDKTLIAGIKIRLGSLVIDGSLVEKLRGAQSKIMKYEA